ncbi:MAG TPA: porin family protein [Cyclobacteriaceae bacterium]|nr:porin family protein [Cyclobacteriaceae bacterium]
MQNANVWNKHHLHRAKVIVITLACLLTGVASFAQAKRWVRKNNPNYDERKISYGFLIGLHSSALQLKYADQFVTPAFDSVYAVQPGWSNGFSLGFIVNFHAEEYLDFRLTPKVSFYEYRVKYVYTNRSFNEQVVSSTMVEFPFLAKYKSARRGNVRMYMVGGITPGIEASGKKDLESSVNKLELERFNVSLEGGFGFDLYYPLFKFSPEIRFSRGLMNVLGNSTNIFGAPLKAAYTNTITVYFLFQ